MRSPISSVTRAIWNVYKVPLLIQIARHFVMAVLQFTAVLMIPSLIAWLQDPNLPSHLGPTYVSIIIGAIFCQRFLMSQGNAHAFKIMCQIQSNMMLAIYEKTLVLAPNRDQDTGKLMSLMGGDTNTIAWTLQALLEAPVALIRVLAVVGVMWTQIGPYCLISIGVLILMLPITAKVCCRIAAKPIFFSVLKCSLDSLGQRRMSRSRFRSKPLMRVSSSSMSWFKELDWLDSMLGRDFSKIE
jgi:hypothetical protein